jgi:hypothetical protein
MNKAAIGGLVLVGCMFIGAGLGMAYDEVVIGSAIGMGIGFLGMAMVWSSGKREDDKKS